MKRTSLVAVALGTLMGCTNQVQPVRLDRFVTVGLQDACTADDTQANSGTLDVAAGAPQFSLGLQFGGTGISTPGYRLRTGEVLEPASAAQPVIDEIMIEYTLSRRLGTLKPFVQRVVFPVATGTAASDPLVVNVISAELGELLVNGLQGSTTGDDFVDIQVKVSGVGEYTNSTAPFSTGTLTFPLRAFKSAPTTCNAPDQYKRFVKFDAAGNPDFCSYVGQAYNASVPPSPTACCTAGSPGC